MFLCKKREAKTIFKKEKFMANMTRAKGNIYNLARLAKERLKTNNYSVAKLGTIDNNKCFFEYISKKKERDNKKIIENKPRQKTLYDDELYKKVCELIESKNTINPISNLIDKDLFSNLDAEAKQFYINNLTQKYKFMRARYFKEHTLSNFL